MELLLRNIKVITMKTNEFDNSNYYVIQGWMINQFHLSGNELLVYAIIYGFSQQKDQKYNGTIQYLADATCSTKMTVNRSLNSLIEKGLIIKSQKEFNNIIFNEYRANLQNVMGSNKMLWGEQQNVTLARELINDKHEYIHEERNNISNDILIKKETNSRFVPPTLDEVRAYCNERNNLVDPEAFIAFYQSNGWKVGKNPMKNWKSAIITWEKNDKNKSSSMSSAKNKPGSAMDYIRRHGGDVQQ